MIKTCLYCGKEFEPLPRQIGPQKYCCKEHRWKAYYEKNHEKILARSRAAYWRDPQKSRLKRKVWWLKRGASA